MAFGADCVTGGAVGSSEKEGAATDAFCWVVGRSERSTLALDFDGRIWERRPHILPYRFDKSRQPVL